MISVRPACRLSVCGKNFNVAIFSDTINMVSVKLCMMVILTEPHPFMPLSWTCACISGSQHSQISLKIVCSYPIELKFSTIVNNIK